VILVVAPSPSVDVTYLLDRFEPHAIHRPRQVVRVPGGKALNAARVAAALGAPIRVVAALGGPTGEWIGAQLHRLGIPVHSVRVALPTRSCVSIAHDSGLTEVYEPATPITAAEWAALLAATAAAAGPGWTVVSGSLPAGAPPDGAARLVAAARAGAGRVCVDTSGPALAAALAAGPDLVKVNATEAADLLRLPADTAPAELARGLHERAGGAGTAVVTAGVLGAAAWTTTAGRPADPPATAAPAGPTAAGEPRRPTVAGYPVTVGPPAERGPYPVGSGDAFLAGLIVALDGGADLHSALHAGTAAAAANAAVPGAGELPATRTAPG
jgi:1-phosphofructokinase/tagatose 6-phosphate kinase